MSDETRSGFASLPLPLAYHINRVCDHYEAACRAGRGPRIEDYVQFEAEPGRGPSCASCWPPSSRPGSAAARPRRRRSTASASRARPR